MMKISTREDFLLSRYRLLLTALICRDHMVVCFFFITQICDVFIWMMIEDDKRRQPKIDSQMVQPREHRLWKKM